MVDIAHAFRSQQFEAALHLANRVAQRIRREFGLGDDWRIQVRNAFVVAQLQPLGIDENQPHLIGRGLVQNRHDEGIDGHTLARAGRAGDEQVRHSGQIGHHDASINIFAEGHGQLRLVAHEFLRFDVLA